MKTTTPAPAKDRAAAPARTNRSWKRFIPYLIGGALLLLIVAGLMPKPIAVETAQVGSGPLVVSVLEEGKTRIRHRYVVSPPISGLLNRVPLRAGAKIEAGKTVLATIQSEPASFLDPRTKAQAEARVKAAEAARYQRETQVERAKAALDLANKEKARAGELKKSGAIATKDWDTAENQVTVLTRELSSAEFALRVAGFELDQAEAALLQAQNPGQDQSEPMKILAPIDGYVLNVHEENARIVAAGTPIMEVGDLNDLECEIELLSADAVGVHIGAEVSIEQWGGDAPLRGRVALIEPGGFTKVSSLGVEEQRVKVRVDFLDALPPGTFLGDRYRVEARIVTWRSDNVLQVPTGALFRRGGDWMTFLVEHGKAKLTKVEIAHNNGIGAEVRSGLTQGQTVVVHAPDSLAEGVSVRQR